MKLVAAFVFAALPICAAAPVGAHDDAATQCVEVGAVSLWGSYGWNHVVYLRNRCSTTVLCDVWTNIEPEVRRVTCNADETVQVVTSVSQPQAVFVPSVSCDFP